MNIEMVVNAIVGIVINIYTIIAFVLTVGITAIIALLLYQEKPRFRTCCIAGAMHVAFWLIFAVVLLIIALIYYSIESYAQEYLAPNSDVWSQLWHGGAELVVDIVYVLNPFFTPCYVIAFYVSMPVFGAIALERNPEMHLKQNKAKITRQKAQQKIKLKKKSNVKNSYELSVGFNFSSVYSASIKAIESLNGFKTVNMGSDWIKVSKRLGLLIDSVFEIDLENLGNDRTQISILPISTGYTYGIGYRNRQNTVRIAEAIEHQLAKANYRGDGNKIE